MRFISASVFFAILTLLFHTTAALPLPQEKPGFHKKVAYTVKELAHRTNAAVAEKKMNSANRNANMFNKNGFQRAANLQKKAAARHRTSMLESQRGVEKYQKKLGKAPNVPE